MKVLIVCICLIIVNTSLSQTERVNSELPKIQTIPTRVLSKANGYCYNESGQWIKTLNKISYPNDTHEEIDNFVSYDLRDIKINDTMYYLFMKKYNTGWFTYPALMQGWNPTIEAEWCVLNRIQIDSLKILNDSVNLIELNPIYEGFVENAYNHRKWNNTTYIEEIQKHIAKKIINKEVVKNKLILHIAMYKSKNIIRFNFYKLYLGFPNMISQEYQPKDPNGKYSFDVLKIYGKTILFNYCYFESDLISFEKLFLLK